MPPKDSNVNNLRPERLFVKPWGVPCEDWQEIGVIEGSTTLVVKDESKAPYDIIYSIPTVFSCAIKFSKKQNVRIMQLFGLLKKPKCTYKTTRRFCAKRNK